MLERLGELYLPFVGWTVFGLVLLRSIPEAIPRAMAQGLYWVGVPLQVLAFTLRAELSDRLGWVPLIVLLALGFGWLLAELCWQFAGGKLGDEAKGSFLLSALVGNTGFVGLALTPYLLQQSYLGWVVLYSLAHNVLVSYGFGVGIVSYYGQRTVQKRWWEHLQAILATPAIWAFVVGWLWKYSQWHLAPATVDMLGQWADYVPPVAFVLVGIRLQWGERFPCQSVLWGAGLAAGIKVVLMPLFIGGVLKLSGLPADAVLAMVLQAGMPTALAGMILAEAYDLAQKQLIAIVIAFSSVGVLFTIPLWLWLFG